MPKKGGAKKQAVGSPVRWPSDELLLERSRWSKLVTDEAFELINVEASGKRWPLRDDQKDELRRWVAGKWDQVTFARLLTRSLQRVFAGLAVCGEWGT